MGSITSAAMPKHPHRFCFHSSYMMLPANVLGSATHCSMHKSLVQEAAVCALAYLESCSCIDCCELASKWRILVAARCLDGGCLHLTYNANLQMEL